MLRLLKVPTRLWLILYVAGFTAAYHVNPAFAVDDAEQHVLPEPCATDPVYQDFEKTQIAAYESDDADFRIFLNSAFQDKVLHDTVNELRRRQSHDKTRELLNFGRLDNLVQSEVKHLKLPTCFENRALYVMIRHFATDVENARQELRLPIRSKPRFGSIPSNDINAYTYLSPDGNDGVIALNYQLFNFVRRMAELAVSAVNSDVTGRPLSQSQVITQALIAIAYNTEAKNSFVATLRGLLLGQPLGRNDVSKMSASGALLVAFFVGSMERFIFAHEYGHLIKGHLSEPATLPIGVNGTREFQVAGRNWQQEFEADEVGLALLTQILLRAAQQYPIVSGYYIFALKAPLFFFDCLDFLDRERYMHEHHQMPPELTDAEKSLVRSCAKPIIPEQDKVRCEAEIHIAHPPAWLREERLKVSIDRTLKRVSNLVSNAALEQKADELQFSVNFFWKETSIKLLESFTQPD